MTTHLEEEEDVREDERDMLGSQITGWGLAVASVCFVQSSTPYGPLESRLPCCIADA